MWTKEEIGNVIKKSRLSAGLTQVQVAKALGRPQNTISAWEMGRAQPDANTLFELFQVLGADLNEAFGFSSGQKNSPSTAEAVPGENLQQEIIRLAGKLSAEQRDLFLAILRLTAARNQGLSAADLVSAGEAALKSEHQNPTK